MATILITGASGFLGAHVAAAARARGHDVRAAVRSSSQRWRLDALAPGVTAVYLDLADRSADLAAALDGVDAVIHCAAYGVDYSQSDIRLALEMNVAATVRLAQVIADANCRMVHVGTSYEYGAADHRLREDHPLAPTGIYGITKAAGTLALLEYARRTDASIAVVRPFSMYGPLEGAHKIIPLAMRASQVGQALELTPGEQQRDYLYVGDVADACVHVVSMDAFPAGETFNVCAGEGVSLIDIVTAAAQAAGGDLGVFHWGAKTYRPDESMSVVGDPSRTRARLGWRAWTTLEHGMRRTADAECLRPAQAESVRS